jgi:hypothetical protein
VKAIQSFLSDLNKAKQLIGKPYEAYRLAAEAVVQP